MQNMIEIGKIVNTHGLRGEVKITPWLDYPEIFEAFDCVYTDDGSMLTVESVRYQKANVIVKFARVADANAAELLKNKTISVPREMFDDLPDGTYLIADIIGLKVVDETTEYGVVTDVIQTGSNDVYVVERKGAKQLLIPALKDVILDTDIRAGVIRVKLPDGLLDI
ncbi:MAG: 16S rRNA processing protein RimM [Clostridia bacterium]|nr:16S rRNA processing protein RimM [Clostridia bacterium]